MKLVLSVLLSAGMLLGAGCSSHSGDQAAPGGDESKTLRIITWSDYIPQGIVDQFKQETGIQVEVSLSNNEEIISKLRATGGAGFDLAQPSQDRIVSAQQEFRIYRPIDLSKVKTDILRGREALAKILMRSGSSHEKFQTS